MYAFKRVGKDGKTIYCYGFGKMLHNDAQSMNVFEPATFSFGRFIPDKVSIGLCIEPLPGERRAGEFKNNTACLFFNSDEEIDLMIEKLKTCKRKLAKKIATAKREEYCERLYGKVVDIQDWRQRMEAQKVSYGGVCNEKH